MVTEIQLTQPFFNFYLISSDFVFEKDHARIGNMLLFQFVLELPFFFQTRKQLVQRSIFSQTSILGQKVTIVQSRILLRKEFCPVKNLFTKYFICEKDHARIKNMFLFQFVKGLPFCCFQTRKQFLQKSIFGQISILVQKVMVVQSRILLGKEFCSEKNSFTKYFICEKDHARIGKMFLFLFFLGLPFYFFLNKKAAFSKKLLQSDKYFRSESNSCSE